MIPSDERKDDSDCWGKIEWLLRRFAHIEGITGVDEHMDRPDAFTEAEWERLLDLSNKIMNWE